MTSFPSDQMDLLPTSADTARGGRGDTRSRWVIVVNHRRWMRFLTEEWLFPSDDAQFVLGVSRPTSSEAEQGSMTVGIWFDPGKLPPLEVLALHGGQWSSRAADETSSADAIAWRGPLPLFAVERFTIGNMETRNHLMAMVRNFADMELPPQPIEVEPVDPAVISAPSFAAAALVPAVEEWNARRGAAAMALWAAPRVGPWLDLLCGWLGDKKATTLAAAAHAPWLSVPPWADGAKEREEFPGLWRAMLYELTRPGLLKEWRPRELLNSIADHARSLGENEARVDRLMHATTALLQDRGTLTELGLHDDVLALALQLLLLRPFPEKFIAWRDDWPAIPPGSWWTGAILAGYLCGFRDLPLTLRGKPPARKLLALRTWQASPVDERSGWRALSPDPVDWRLEGDFISIRAGNDVVAEHKVGTRGRWYAADLRDLATRQAAEDLARQHCPDLMVSTLLLANGEFGFTENGKILVDHQKKVLHVEGRVMVTLGPKAQIESKLDELAFRSWLTSAGIRHRLPKPPAAVQPTTAMMGEPTQPKGLRLIKDFIGPGEEDALLSVIDAEPWNNSMTRRVQHYGWRYEYKARKVDSSGYLGPLPDWAKGLAKRLHSGGFVPELPDQVIVNEYVGAQGISKHVDCLSCFRGPIVTISLIETWEMVFSRKSDDGEAQKFVILLDRGSAAILDGEARHIWQHEIPRKKGRPPRGRRVSITFRKVNV